MKTKIYIPKVLLNTTPIRHLQTLIVFLLCYFVYSEELFAGEMSSADISALIKEIRHNTPIAILSFESQIKKDAYIIIDGDQQVKINRPATELLYTLGKQSDILRINGTFKLLHNISGDFPDHEIVQKSIPVEMRWGGDSMLHRLRPLIPLAGETNRQAFVVIKPKNNTELVEALFVGPIGEDQMQETIEFLKFVQWAYGKNLSRKKLSEMLHSGLLLNTHFAINNLLKDDATCTAQLFFDAIKVLPHKYSAEIAHDLFMESKRNSIVRSGMLSSMKSFFNASAPLKEIEVLRQLNEELVRMALTKDDTTRILKIKILLKDYQKSIGKAPDTNALHEEIRQIQYLFHDN